MKQNWIYKKIGEICDVKTGKLDANASDENGLYPFFTCSKEPLHINTFSYDAECILVAGNGDLNVKYYNGKFDAYQRTYIITLKHSVTNISVKYLFCFFLLYIDALREKSIGGVIKYIKLGDITEAIVPVPPLADQSRIVAELDLLQSIIDKQKAQLKEYDTLAQSIFYDMFGDPVDNEKGWEMKKLGEIVSDDCPISYGIVQPGDGVANGIPIVRPVDMTHTFVYRQGLKKTTKEISNSYKRTILKGNEILLCVRGTTGLVSLATDELKGCNVTRGVTPLECNTQNDRWFVYFQFLTNAIQQHIAEYTKGIALKQINMKDVREIPLITPPLSLQQTFAAKIEAIEQQKTRISQSIAEAQKLFDYTMDKYFG